jgi:hypothetical protein
MNPILRLVGVSDQDWNAILAEKTCKCKSSAYLIGRGSLSKLAHELSGLRTRADQKLPRALLYALASWLLSHAKAAQLRL